MRVARLVASLTRTPNSHVNAALIAVGLSAGATVLRLTLNGVIDLGQAPFAAYYPATLLAALWGGSRAGVLSVFLAAVLGEYFFVPPLYGIEIDSLSEWLSLLLFVVSALLIVAVAHAYRFTLTELNRALAARELLGKEQAHRVRNLVAVAQAIVSNTLGRSQDAGVINTRLTALLGNNEDLSNEDHAPSDLEHTLKKALSPFETKQIAFEGSGAIVDGQIGRSIALIVHELATNAVKYGSLSAASGSARVAWQSENDCIRLSWNESGGPPATVPERKGFGIRFLEQLVHQRNGTITFSFTQKGLSAEVVLPCVTVPQTAAVVNLFGSTS